MSEEIESRICEALEEAFAQIENIADPYHPTELSTVTDALVLLVQGLREQFDTHHDKTRPADSQGNQGK